MFYLSRRNWHYLVGGILAMIACAAFEGAQFGSIVPLADRIFTNKPLFCRPACLLFWCVTPDQLNALDRYTLFYGIIVLIPDLLYY